jgi:hypothetical protein
VEADTPSVEERLRRAYQDGFAAAARGDEAAPGCTTSAEGRAFLRGYITGAERRAEGSSAEGPGAEGPSSD